MSHGGFQAAPTIERARREVVAALVATGSPPTGPQLTSRVGAGSGDPTVFAFAVLTGEIAVDGSLGDRFVVARSLGVSWPAIANAARCLLGTSDAELDGALAHAGILPGQRLCIISRR